MASVRVTVTQTGSALPAFRLRDAAEPILMPGDPERASRQARAEKVPVDAGTLAELDAAAAAVAQARGVALPLLSSLAV